MELMQLKKTHITRFIILLIILFVVNVLGGQFHKRFDLTKEKRFSLSEVTKNYLQELDDIVTVKIFLQGNLPAGFQRLQDRAEEVLTEFKEYSGGKIKYEYVNVLGDLDNAQKQRVMQDLAKKGINPVNLKVQQDADEGISEKIIFPAALVAYNGKEFAVNLLESHKGMTPQEVLDYSGTLLEYKFAQAIQKTKEADLTQIAYIMGNGQDLGWDTYDMLAHLEKLYKIDTIDINQNIEIPIVYKAIIISAPKIAFDEKVKFKIDQFVMRGGRILWMLDKLNTGMDTLQKSDAYLATDLNLNLEDILFKYGVRINPDLIEDVQQSLPIPVTVGMLGNQPDIKLLPWIYFPYCVPTSTHPIVKNMDAIMMQFASSIDTVNNPEIKKTILLHSSNRCRRVNAPLRISLASVRYKPKVELYNEQAIPMAVLLEGKFESIYTNRLDPNFLTTLKDSLNREFMPQANKPGKMIVISNGAMFRNDVSQKQGPLECGFYKYTNQLYANKSFISNCLEYLTDDTGLLDARNKDMSLRLLDMPRVNKEKLKWQMINIALPVLLTILFGSAFLFFRRKKYTGKVS
jgi:ABC-2 type transport system permease protein